MKVTLRNILLITLVGLLINCEDDDITSREYPRLKTLPVSEITTEGAKFNAEIVSRDNFEIINYGFVWSENENPILESSNRVIYSKNIQSHKFSEIIETTLKEEASYFVRAFVKTHDFVVYGENVEFLSLGSKAPKIFNISPLEGTVGDTISIAGSNLSYLNHTNEVSFNNIKAQVISSSDSILSVLVPEIMDLNNIIAISIVGNSSTHPNPFISTSPKIDSISSQLVSFEDTIEIYGGAFSYLNSANKILLGNSPANVIMSSKTKIKFIVPSNLEKSTNRLRLVLGGREDIYDSISIKPPKIDSIDIKIITNHNNGNITILGNNFNPLIEKNSVLFGSISATIVSSTHDNLIVEIPRNLIKKIELSVLDTIDLTVNVLDQSSTLVKQFIVDYRSTWTKMRDFPGLPRLFGASFSIGNKGYIGLGIGDVSNFWNPNNWYKDFWEYDMAQDSWTKLSDLPGVARSNFSSFVIGNKAYIICGTIGNKYTSTNNLNEVWEFNGLTQTWTQKSNFPGGARFNSFGFSIGNNGYVGAGAFGQVQKNDFWKYEPLTDSWVQLTNISNNISNNIVHTDIFATSFNGFGYLITRDCSPCSGRSFWQYNPTTDTWTSKSAKPEGNEEIVGFTVNNKLYAGTGFSGDWSGTRTFYSYDPNSDVWTNTTPFLEKRRAASSFAINNYGFLLLGKSGCHCANKNDVWKFDPSK
jgi:N-acetylneuraminic acid mutarotase